MAAYRGRDPQTVLRVCTFAAKVYGERLESKRERTIGEDSDWSRRRDKVARAADGAGSAVAYWNERAREDPESQAIRERLAAASALGRKLSGALRSMDEQATEGRGAYAECQASINDLLRRIDDLEQIRDLHGIPEEDRAGGTLADVSVKAVTADLVEAAAAVGVAIRELPRLELRKATEDEGNDLVQLADSGTLRSEQKRKSAEVAQHPVTETPKAAPTSRPRDPATPRPSHLERDAELEEDTGVATAPRFSHLYRIAELEEERFEILRAAQERQRQFEEETGYRTREEPVKVTRREEDRLMKELVEALRKMAGIQERRAHDLRFRDEYNYEADDREELAEKMTELADEIEMFERVREKMREHIAKSR